MLLNPIHMSRPSCSSTLRGRASLSSSASSASLIPPHRTAPHRTAPHLTAPPASARSLACGVVHAASPPRCLACCSACCPGCCPGCACASSGLWFENAMFMGRVRGPEELAAVSLANLAGNLSGLSIVFGLLTSVETLAPQAMGAGRKVGCCSPSALRLFLFLRQWPLPDILQRACVCARAAPTPEHRFGRGPRTSGGARAAANHMPAWVRDACACVCVCVCVCVCIACGWSLAATPGATTTSCVVVHHRPRWGSSACAGSRCAWSAVGPSSSSGSTWRPSSSPSASRQPSPTSRARLTLVWL